jgi:HAMP domain-containing protein
MLRNYCHILISLVISFDIYYTYITGDYTQIVFHTSVLLLLMKMNAMLTEYNTRLENQQDNIGNTSTDFNVMDLLKTQEINIMKSEMDNCCFDDEVLRKWGLRSNMVRPCDDK